MTLAGCGERRPFCTMVGDFPFQTFQDNPIRHLCRGAGQSQHMASDLHKRIL